MEVTLPAGRSLANPSRISVRSLSSSAIQTALLTSMTSRPRWQSEGLVTVRSVGPTAWLHALKMARRDSEGFARDAPPPRRPTPSKLSKSEDLFRPTAHLFPPILCEGGIVPEKNRYGQDPVGGVVKKSLWMRSTDVWVSTPAVRFPVRR